MQRRLLVVAVTRLRDATRRCVGAYAMDDGSSLRLLDAQGRNQLATSFRIGDVVEATVAAAPDREPPHIEDVRVRDERKIDVVPRARILPILENLGVVIHGDFLERAFERSLRWTANDSGFVDRTGVPRFSTCLWSSDRAWIFDGQGYYRAPSRRGGHVRVRYVGEDTPQATVEVGDVVRLSLARWWRGDGAPDERCYLQWSGVLPVEPDGG